MAEMLRLEMVTPYKQILAVDVDEVTAPGALGEFGIFPGHTPLLTTLKIGELTYRQGTELFHVAVNWGYVEVENDKVTVLVETAEAADQIDLARAKEALSRAETALKSLSPDDVEFCQMEAALQRALIRIHVAEEPARRGH
jgi:F-type H+-transporting ATPase subunit epsilon